MKKVVKFIMITNSVKYEHIIWDWNGTLMNDAALCVEILNHLLERRHMSTISTERYQDEFQIPVIEYYRQLGFDFNLEPYAKLADEFIAEYERRKFECPLQPHAKEVLDFFRKSGRRQSILTAYRQDKLQEMVDFYEIRPFFTHLVGLNDHLGGGKIAQGKKMIQLLNQPTQTILLIGDTLHDLDVARAMGVDCILIPSGHQSHKRLAAATEAQTVASLADLIA